MPDLIFITQSKPVGFDGVPLNVPDDEGGITVHYARLRSDDDLQLLLAGASFPELGEGAIIERGEIVPPDGTPLQDFEMGYPSIASFEEAADVARAARTNPKSVLVAKGFAADTPIYFVTKNHKAQPLD